MPYVSMNDERRRHSDGVLGEGNTLLTAEDVAATSPVRHMPLTWADYLAHVEKPTSLVERANLFTAKHSTRLLIAALVLAALVTLAGVYNAPWEVHRAHS
jgi:hypothetical protein